MRESEGGAANRRVAASRDRCSLCSRIVNQREPRVFRISPRPVVLFAPLRRPRAGCDALVDAPASESSSLSQAAESCGRSRVRVVSHAVAGQGGCGGGRACSDSPAHSSARRRAWCVGPRVAVGSGRQGREETRAKWSGMGRSAYRSRGERTDAASRPTLEPPGNSGRRSRGAAARSGAGRGVVGQLETQRGVQQHERRERGGGARAAQGTLQQVHPISLRRTRRMTRYGRISSGVGETMLGRSSGVFAIVK